MEPTGPWEERARQMLAEVAAAELEGRSPSLAVYRESPDWEPHARLLDDLFAEHYLRSDGKPLKDGAGAYVGIRGLRLTVTGRRWLERQQEESAGVTVDERRGLEVVLRIVGQAGEAGELEQLGEAGREIAAQTETIRVQLYEAPEPDRSIVRRALRRVWQATDAVSTVAGLTGLAQLPAAIQAIGSLLG